MPVCFFQSMEYQRLSAKMLTAWEVGIRRGLHAKCSRKGELSRFNMALREVITYMTVTQPCCRLPTDASSAVLGTE